MDRYMYFRSKDMIPASFCSSHTRVLITEDILTMYQLRQLYGDLEKRVSACSDIALKISKHVEALANGISYRAICSAVAVWLKVSGTTSSTAAVQALKPLSADLLVETKLLLGLSGASDSTTPIKQSLSAPSLLDSGLRELARTALHDTAAKTNGSDENTSSGILASDSCKQNKIPA